METENDTTTKTKMKRKNKMVGDTNVINAVKDTKDTADTADAIKAVKDITLSMHTKDTNVIKTTNVSKIKKDIFYPTYNYI